MKSIVKKQPVNAGIVEQESKFERLVIESPNHKGLPSIQKLSPVLIQE